MNRRRATPTGTALVLAGILAAFGTCPSASAANLGFLKDSPISHFNKKDNELMMETALKVLDSTEPRATAEWSNPKSGNSGTVTTIGSFTSTEGLACKRIRVFNKAKAVEGSANHTVCQFPDRGWLVHADARPAGKTEEAAAN